METQTTNEAIVVDIYNIPNKKKFRNRKLWKLPCISAADATFGIWEGSYKKVYIPKDGIVGYNLEAMCLECKVKFERY